MGPSFLENGTDKESSVTLSSWVIVSTPVAALLAVLFFAWRYVRRGTTAIHRAAALGNVARLKQLLLASPESVNHLDMIGFSPLQQAAYWGQAETARLLLEHKAALTVDQGLSPLHHAASGGHEDVVGLLLEHGADVNVKSPSDDSTPLHCAVINRRADVARQLLDAGADINAITKSGWTACHFAASNGDEVCMALLLEHNADWQSLNAGDESPLQLALANGHPKIVELVQQLEIQPSANNG